MGYQGIKINNNATLNGTLKSFEKKHDSDLSYRPEDIEDSYFGGFLKFRTKIVWTNVTFFLVIHLLGFYGWWICFQQMLQLRFLTTVAMYTLGFFGGEGVTVGAHRLWSHRSYKARRPLRILLVICQTIAGENCVHTWVKEHRQHHKFTDTDADPHNATRGLFFSHVGWLMMRRHPEYKSKRKTIHMADVESDPVVMFQKKHFKKFFFVFGILIPVLTPYLMWGETFWNSIFTCFFGRYILLLNITWTVNSLAHVYGNRPYDKDTLSTENAFVSFLGYGEGWHNYHHAFPWDYKASEYGKHLNFTRDFIEFCERRGWAYHLKEASQEMVAKKISRSGDGSHHTGQNAVITHQPASQQEDEEGW